MSSYLGGAMMNFGQVGRGAVGVGSEWAPARRASISQCAQDPLGCDDVVTAIGRIQSSNEDHT